MADFVGTFDSNLCDTSREVSGIFKIPACNVDNNNGAINGNSKRHQINLHISSNGVSYESELPLLLRRIVDKNSTCKRIEVLHDLRNLIRKSEGKLPDVDRMQFFEAFYSMLADGKSKIVRETSMLIVDIIPQMGEHDLDPCMSIILPRVIPNLGHESTDVRRASLRLIHVYMRYTNNLQKLLRMYIQYGLENNDKSAQKGCVLSLPLLFTEEFSKENLFPLVKSLGYLLVHAEANLFYPIFLAIQRLHTLVGEDIFQLYLQHLLPETVILYQKVLSRASTAESAINSNNNNNTDDNHNSSNTNHDTNSGDHDRVDRENSHSQIIKANQIVDGDKQMKHQQEESEDDFQANLQEKHVQQFKLNDDQPDHDDVDAYSRASSAHTIPIEKIITNGDLSKHFHNLSFQQLSEAKQAFINSMAILQDGAMDSEEEEDEEEDDEREDEDEEGHRNNEQNLEKIVRGEKKSTDELIDDSKYPTITSNQVNYYPSKEKQSNDDISMSSDFDLAFGIFPISVINRTFSIKMPDRLQGVNQMLNIMRESPTTYFAMLANYLPNFMEKIVIPLVDHYNFKMTISGLEMLEIIVERLRLTAYPYLKQIIAIILKRLGDGRAVVREHDIKVIHQLMFHFPLQNVLNQLLECKHHRNPKVREEIINRVIVALLMFPRNEFNLNRLSYEISSMLIDPKKSIRLAAIECMAVIAQALGPHRLPSIFLIVQAIEQATQSEGLVAAVQARLARRDLPRCNPDGSLRYVLNVTPYAGWFPATSEPDIEWILSAPNTGQPEKLPFLPFFSNKMYQRFDVTETDEEAGKGINESCIDSDKSEENRRQSTVECDIHQSNIYQVDQKNRECQDKDGELSSSGIKSPKSDDSSKNRELWRYYFMRFKQHLAEATCSTASSGLSNGLNVAMNWNGKINKTEYNSHINHPHDIAKGFSKEEQKKLDEIKFLEQFGGNLAGKIGYNYNNDDDDNFRPETPIGNRAISMPTLCSSDQIFSGSDKSIIDINTIIHGNGKSKNMSFMHPRSVPSSPEKKHSTVSESEYEINSDRSKSRMNGQISMQDCNMLQQSNDSSPSHPYLLAYEPIEVAPKTAKNVVNNRSKISRRASVIPASLHHRTNNEGKIMLTPETIKPRRPSILPLVNVASPSSTGNDTTINQDQSLLPSTTPLEISKDEQSSQSAGLNRLQAYNVVNGKSHSGDGLKASKGISNVHQDCEDQEENKEKGKKEAEAEEEEKTERMKDRLTGHDDTIYKANGVDYKNIDLHRQQQREQNDRVPDDAKEEEKGDDNEDGVNREVEQEEDEAEEEEENECDECLSPLSKVDGYSGQYVATVEQEEEPERMVSDVNTKGKSRTPVMKRKSMVSENKRLSRSSSPPTRRSQLQMIKIQPAIPPNANIRHIMENVVKTEGPFENPEEAMKATIVALKKEAWTTKVEGMLAITRLASFHPTILQRDLHSVIVALVDEVKNLRSSVSRSAIFTLGDLFLKMRKHIEPEMELIGSALLNKCSENTSFIREDCEKALMNMIEEMPHIKSTLVLIHYGANHRNLNVRRTSAHFVAILAEKMGPLKCLMGPRDIGENLLQTASKFLMDGSPHTRYYGRKIFLIMMNNNSFEKLLRKHITPSMYRNISGILDSIKRRGVGEKPADLTSPIKG